MKYTKNCNTRFGIVLSISYDIVSSKIYDRHGDFDFEIVNFPFWDVDVAWSTSYGVYISQIIRFARASSHVADFNTRNKLLTQELLKQGYRYHKLRKHFLDFIDGTMIWFLNSKLDLNLSFVKDFRNLNSMVTCCINLRRLLALILFSAQFIKIISHYKNNGYNINVLQETACLVINPITIGNFTFLFNCTPVGRTSDFMTVPS